LSVSRFAPAGFFVRFTGLWFFPPVYSVFFGLFYWWSCELGGVGIPIVCSWFFLTRCGFCWCGAFLSFFFHSYVCFFEGRLVYGAVVSVARTSRTFLVWLGFSFFCVRSYWFLNCFFFMVLVFFPLEKGPELVWVPCRLELFFWVVLFIAFFCVLFFGFRSVFLV